MSDAENSELFNRLQAAVATAVKSNSHLGDFSFYQREATGSRCFVQTLPPASGQTDTGITGEIHGNFVRVEVSSRAEGGEEYLTVILPVNGDGITAPEPVEAIIRLCEVQTAKDPFGALKVHKDLEGLNRDIALKMVTEAEARITAQSVTSSVSAEDAFLDKLLGAVTGFGHFVQGEDMVGGKPVRALMQRIGVVMGVSATLADGIFAFEDTHEPGKPDAKVHTCDITKTRVVDLFRQFCETRYSTEMQLALITAGESVTGGSVITGSKGGTGVPFSQVLALPDGRGETVAFTGTVRQGGATILCGKKTEKHPFDTPAKVTAFFDRWRNLAGEAATKLESQWNASGNKANAELAGKMIAAVNAKPGEHGYTASLRVEGSPLKLESGELTFFVETRSAQSRNADGPGAVLFGAGDVHVVSLNADGATTDLVARNSAAANLVNACEAAAAERDLGNDTPS